MVAGVRRAAVGAAAGALATRCWRSGTPTLERAPAWGPPAIVNCLMATAVIQAGPPLRAGGDWPVDTRGADRGCAPRPVRGGARRCVCAKHAVAQWCCGAVGWWVFVVRAGRAALLEPPAVASAAAAAHCAGSSPLRGSGGDIVAGRYYVISVFGRAVAREPGRPLWSSAARTRAGPRRAPPPSLLTVP